MDAGVCEDVVAEFHREDMFNLVCAGLELHLS